MRNLWLNTALEPTADERFSLAGSAGFTTRQFGGGSAAFGLGVTRMLFSMFAFLASALLAIAGDFPSKPVFAFSLTATNQSFSQELDSGLILRVERDELGWEVGVFRRHSTDSLLYPQHNWHGAFPCQLSAWSQQSRTFPDERIIPIRGSKSSVCIRLIDAKVSGKSGSEKYTGGRVEIFYKHDA